MMPGRRTRQWGHCHDARDGRPPTPPRYSLASDDADTPPASYAVATARPPGSTTTPRAHPVAQPSPLCGMPLLLPQTTLRQVDLTDWTPNWDDNGNAAPSTGDLKESDSEIHGTKETKLDDASAVDNTAAANQAPTPIPPSTAVVPPSSPLQIPPTLWRVTLHPFWILPPLIAAHHLNTRPGLPLAGPQPQPPSTLWPN
jgi:hypothetical protein